MELGGQCVMTPLDRLTLTWHVGSWAILQPLSMELLAAWGKYKLSRVHRSLEDFDFQHDLPLGVELGRYRVHKVQQICDYGLGSVNKRYLAKILWLG